MRRTAVFMGAGASKAFGYPLTGELFPAIRADLRKRVAFEGIPPRSKNDELMKLLRRLLPGFLTEDRLPYITDVLSLIDYSLLVSNAAIARANTQDLLRFRILLEEAIFHALWWPYDPFDPPHLLERMVKWLRKNGQTKGRQIGLISTNYDIAIEDLLFHAYRGSYARIAEKFDFGMAWRTPWGRYVTRPRNPDLCVYKLHGSLNWLRCDLCEHIYVNITGSIAHQAFRRQLDDYNKCHCEHGPLRAVLVAPSLVRDVRDANLLEIWKAALEYLRVADEWIIIGYSFPVEDISIRSLFLRAYQGRPPRDRPRIRVIQPAEDLDTTARYRLFFPQCTFEYGGMEAFVKGLRV
jgi:hypothetical protein